MFSAKFSFFFLLWFSPSTWAGQWHFPLTAFGSPALWGTPVLFPLLFFPFFYLAASKKKTVSVDFFFFFSVAPPLFD